MNRRDFLGWGLLTSCTPLALRSLLPESAMAAEENKKDSPKGKGKDAGSKIAEKDILKPGEPTTIANYCDNPEKQPNKNCPDYKSKPGSCAKCTFFNKDNSEASFKGKKYAHCQLLTDPKKPQFVSENGWCATFVPKS